MGRRAVTTLLSSLPSPQRGEGSQIFAARITKELTVKHIIATPTRITGLWVVLLSFRLFAFSSAASAAGIEYQGQEDDFVVTVDGRWAGGMNGGYYPIRVRIQNRGTTRDLEVRFAPGDNGLPKVSRFIACPQNANTVMTLLVPMVGGVNHGELQFRYRGSKLKDISRSIALPELDTHATRPALLVIANESVDGKPFESAVTSTVTNTATHRGGGITHAENHHVTQPVLLPNTALGYSGLDIVAVSIDTLTALNSETRDAILNWTRTGGTLLVYEVEGAAEQSQPLSKLLGLDRTTQKAAWTLARPEQRQLVPIISVDQFGNPTGTTTTGAEAEFKWQATTETFAVREYGLGRVAVFADNPFPGSAHDWSWFMKSIEIEKTGRWGNRLGVNGRVQNHDFLQFLIEGIRSVPVYSFLAFITLFAVVIGPVNYYLLAKRKRLNFLIATVPMVAVATTLFLFVFAALSHGFTVKSRVRSLTVIDQGLQTAVVASRLSLYAGMSPSGGLSFSPETAVIPVWAPEQEFESGTLDWTDTQHLSSGWLRARTKTQFFTLTNRAERGRLTIDPPVAGQLRLTNGLEWELSALAVTDDNGQVFYGKDIAAGAPASLKPIDDAGATELRELLAKSAPGNPEDLIHNSGNFFNDFSPSRRHRYGYYGYGATEFRLANGLMERRIAEAKQLQFRIPSITNGRENYMPPRTYLALTKSLPGIELGTETEVTDGWHLVLGSY